MDSKQIDIATREKLPVACNGVRYKRILECVSWYDGRRNRQSSAVLLAENGNYSVRVPAHLVNLLVEAGE